MQYGLVVSFRGQGFRWPLRAGDSVEVWTETGGSRLIATLPADFLLAVIQQHLETRALAMRFAAYCQESGGQTVSDKRLALPGTSDPPPRLRIPESRRGRGRPKP